MEAEIFDTHFLHELEACVYLVFGCLHGVGGTVPGEVLCAAAELVGTFGAEGVPPSHGEFEPFFHRFAEDHAFGVVVAVC